MTTKHTPGPWHAGEPFESFPGAELRFHISQAEGAPYTQHYSDVANLLAETIPGEKLDIQRANARLIAAAPELLDALEVLLDMDISYQRGPKVQEAESAARLAVAKARGAQ
ncbi:hypothetical protein [Achromobacter marplatensis]